MYKGVEAFGAECLTGVSEAKSSRVERRVVVCRFQESRLSHASACLSEDGVHDVLQGEIVDHDADFCGQFHEWRVVLRPIRRRGVAGHDTGESSVTPRM